ncbi:MAG: hypothetical protein NUV53_04730 [Patescibacteria group bacterium]|nr:hypothetical protein [Patescibacteria group bacterium]
MIIFLHGPDDYRRTKEKSAIIEKFLHKHSAVGFRVFDCAEEDSFVFLSEFAKSSGLFNTQRLAVLESAWEAPEKELKEWLSAVQSVKHITALISEHDTPKKEFAFLKKKPVIIKEFNVLQGTAWEKFILAEAKSRGVLLAADAVKFFAQIYRGDSWRLATELDKVALFAGGSVSLCDLERLGLEIPLDSFSLIRKFGVPDKKVRLATLEELFLTRNPAAKIFNILSAFAPARAAQFAEYDYAIKNGKLDYEEALTDLALS